MMKTVAVIAPILIASSPASAQRVVQETSAGTELTAPVGGIVWEKSSFDGVPGVTIHGTVQANWGAAEKVYLAEGSNLITIRQKKLKACRQQTATIISGMTFGGWVDCLIDTNSDGLFDRVSFNEVAGAKDIEPPVPYTRGTIPITGGSAQSFKQTITFLGKSGNDIRLSYREFSNELARPAFTEDLTLPVPTEFPQTMLVKDVKLTVLGIGSSGLTYRID